MTEHNKDARRKDRSGDASGKRAYRKPRLVEYGSVAKLTQGTRTKQSDGPGGGFRMSCF